MKKIIVLCLCLSGLDIQAQTRKDQLRQIDIYFYDENFENVLDLSDKLEQEYPEETGHIYHKTIAYHLLNRGREISDLLAFEDSEAKSDKFYNYWMGRVHMSRYELTEAVEHFQAFLDIKTYKSGVIRDEARYLLEWAKVAAESYNDPNDYEIEHLPKGINTKYEDLSPAFFDGHQELVFTSNRLTGKNRNGKYQIFHASKVDGSWSEASPLEQIGKFDYDNAKIEIIEQDAGLYYYKDDYDGSFYVCSYDDEEGWTAGLELDEKLRKRHIESHFFINDQKNMILFAQGSGDRHDLYQMDLRDGEWSQPYPIPGLINGEESDEENPFVSHDGSTLYFSSNRDGTLGGYDIFKSDWDEDKNEWRRPVNMGFPINTLDDEVNFELTPSDQSGYLASNRLHSLGGFDIYYFHKEAKIVVKGLVADQKSGLPVPFAQVKFHPQTYEDESFIAYTDEEGRYEALVFNRDEFHVEVLVDETKIYDDRYTSYVPTDATFLTFDLSVDLPDNTKQHTNYTALYEGEDEEENVSIDMIGNKFRSGKKAVVNNIYFDYRSYHLEESSAPILEEIRATLTKYPSLKIEIAGHTDNTGNDETNLLLSQKRAEAVRTHLVEYGVDGDRLIAKGYGAKLPLASNDDEKDGRELNRRIEIVALEEGNLDPAVIVSSK